MQPRIHVEHVPLGLYVGPSNVSVDVCARCGLCVMRGGEPTEYGRLACGFDKPPRQSQVGAHETNRQARARAAKRKQEATEGNDETKRKIQNPDA